MNIENKKKTGKIEQLWDLDYKNPAMNVPDKEKPKKDKPKKGGLVNPPYGMKPGEAFYLRSRLPMQRVMDVLRSNLRYIVTMNYEKNRLSQQWYFDKSSKTIKCKKYKDQSINSMVGGH